MPFARGIQIHCKYPESGHRWVGSPGVSSIGVVYPFCSTPVINVKELCQRAPSNPCLANLQTQVFQRGKGMIQTEDKLKLKTRLDMI